MLALFARHKVVIIILLLALFVRGVFFVAFWYNNGFSQDKIIAGDATEYHAIAVSLVEKGRFSFDGVIPNARRTPIYPLFIGTVYSLFGTKPWIVLLFQIFLDTVTCLLIYILAIIIFNNKKVALAGGLLYSIEPVSAVFSIELVTDIFFTFVFVLSLVVLFLAIKKERIIIFAAAGAILGLAALTRPIALYFFVVAILIIILISKNKISHRLKMAVIFLIMFELVLLPWQLRNFINFGSFNITSMQGYNLLHSNAVTAEAILSKTSTDEARSKFEKLMPRQEILNNMEKSKIQQGIALNYIKNHLKDYLILHFKGIGNMFINSTKYEIMRIFGLEKVTGYDEDMMVLSGGIINRLKQPIINARKDHYLIFPLSFLAFLEYIMALIGLIWLFVKKRWRIAIILIAIIAYYSLITGIIGEARFKLPIIPIYLMLSGYGIVALVDYFRQKMMRGRTTKFNTTN